MVTTYYGTLGAFLRREGTVARDRRLNRGRENPSRRDFVKGAAAAASLAAAGVKAHAVPGYGDSSCQPDRTPPGRPQTWGSAPDDFDVAVIGSGFGGAVVACRLAEAGKKVVVLERGRRWTTDQYPRKLGDAWLYLQHDPVRHNGWFDFRLFRRIGMVMGAGVGGGSLHYANVVIDAEPSVFQQPGWPPEISAVGLEPYFCKVTRMMKTEVLPENQENPRTRILREAAERSGFGDRYRKVDLAVTFDESYAYDAVTQVPNPKDTKYFINEHGVRQGTCVHLGNCVVGCDVEARNTLATNYIPRAERFHAQVRPLHLVDSVQPAQGGYRVHYDRIESGRRRRGSVRARIVVVSAGSLGSTELLLRSRDEHKTLPGLSRRLGHGWCSNTNILNPADHPRRELYPSRGPTISARVNLLEETYDGQALYIEDGGFPDLPSRLPRELGAALSKLLKLQPGNVHLMPWFAQGRDQSRGVFRLRRKLFGGKVLDLHWKRDHDRAAIQAVRKVHKAFAEATGGTQRKPLDYPITPHPLGGCNMAGDREHGVVDHAGRVFGYPGLYVADGSIIPAPVGHNPSKTIAALGERIAEKILEDDV